MLRELITGRTASSARRPGALTVFAKSGLPFALPTANTIRFDVWSLQCSSALSALPSVRFGRFLQHSAGAPPGWP